MICSWAQFLTTRLLVHEIEKQVVKFNTYPQRLNVRVFVAYQDDVLVYRIEVSQHADLETQFLRIFL